MICKQCGKSFPHRTGSYCGGCQKPLPEYKGLYPAERAASLEEEAQKLGLDRPTESMIASAINDAVSDVLLWVDGTTARWHGAYYDVSIAKKRWDDEDGGVQ